MNRTELAQALAGGFQGSKQPLYNAIALMLNEVTDEQLAEFVKIYQKVMK